MALDPSGAMTSRIEQTFDYPALNLFFVTGQPTGQARFDGLGERYAGIACIPYNQLKENEFAAMKQKSAAGGSHVTILINEQDKRLQLYDQFTRVTSYCAFDRLDAEIQQKLARPSRGPTLSL